MGPPRVLIAEDDHHIRSLIRDRLTALGVLVLEASDGADAIAQLEDFRPDLAIIDFLLPQQNGFQVAEAARAACGQSLPLIMISGIFKNPKVMAEAREKYGVIDYLTKPFDLNYLATLVRDALPPAPADVESDLLDRIRADRDAVDPYLVYADWLQANEQPRGELIALQHEELHAKDEARRRELGTAQVELLTRHPGLLGCLRTLLGRPVETPSRVFDAGHFVGNPAYGPLAADWYLGFVRKVRIALGDPITPDDVYRIFRRLSNSDTTEHTRELTIGSFRNRHVSSYQEVHASLPMATLDLTALYIGDLSDEAPSNPHGTILPAKASFQRLRRLALRGGEMRIDPLDLPELEDLRVFSSSRPDEIVAGIARSTLPKLSHLHLWFSSARFRPELLPLDFPTLRSLGLGSPHPGTMGALIASLAQRPLARRLELLDLSHAALDDEAARVLLRSVDAFSKLKALRIDPHGIPEAIVMELAQRYPFFRSR